MHHGRTAPSPRPRSDDAAVMTHVLTAKTDFVTGLIWAKVVGGAIKPDEIHALSAWVYIPSDFRGTSVGVVFDAFPSLKIQNASLTIRDHWQQVWVSSRFSDKAKTAHPGLVVVGEPGDIVFSTCWKLEAGVVPTPEP